MSISASERKRIAALVGCNEQFLYQCLTGRNAMEVKEAVRVERDSQLAVRRWHLRSRDWWECWPELVGTEGAPPVPSTEPVSGAA